MVKQLTELQKASRKALREKRKANKAVGKLKKTIMYLDVGNLDYQQWVAYRKNYIGGSDMSTLFGLNPYQSKLELFHEKVGVISKTGVDTEATYSGRSLEEYIIEKYWIYHDMSNPTPEVLIANASANKWKRHARKVKDKMMYDPKYSHIKINVDGLIQNTRFEIAPRGILEIKSGLSRVWNTYEAGIPAFYIIQVQVYMLVTGLKYAEIGVLLDGRYFKCFPIEANKAIQDKILESAQEFWDLVQEGRLIWDDKTLTESERIQYLSAIEPEIDGGAALDIYLKERFRSDYKAGQMMISDEIIETANKYLEAGAVVKEKETVKKLYSNALKKLFLDNKVDEIIDADNKVIITNRRSDSGKSPILRINKSVLKLV